MTTYLTSSVYHLNGKILILVSYHLGKSVFNGRIVGIDKVAVDKLDCEGTLACADI